MVRPRSEGNRALASGAKKGSPPEGMVFESAQGHLNPDKYSFGNKAPISIPEMGVLHDWGQKIIFTQSLMIFHLLFICQVYTRVVIDLILMDDSFIGD
jgi:hypothetical protein